MAGASEEMLKRSRESQAKRLAEEQALLQGAGVGLGAGADPGNALALLGGGSTALATAQLGTAGGALAIAAALYGLAQAVGVEFPWETPEGEGFIAPWTPTISMGQLTLQAPQVPGDMVVSAWNTNPQDTRYGWTFYRLASGKMGTYTKTGMWKTWRPYRSIVIGKSLTASNVKRVSTRLKSHVKALKTVLKILK